MKNRIKNLLKQNYSSFDISLQSHFLNHICVLISGYLEKKITEIVVNYKSSNHFRSLGCKDTNRVNNISARAGKGIQNAKWCSIKPIFFNIDIKIISRLKRLKNFDSEIVASIDNIVRTRHKIAHGENVTNLTIQILTDDFRNIQKFLNQLNKIFSSSLLV
jgi:hypothetical protein